MIRGKNPRKKPLVFAFMVEVAYIFCFFCCSSHTVLIFVFLFGFEQKHNNKHQ